MRGRRWVLGLIICLVAGEGCSDKNGVPGGILPRDKMEQVMWDMAQADQYAALYLAKDSAHIDRKAETMRLYEEVFRLHQVTREEFRKSYRYYLDHPALNQILFDSVIARGVRARSEMYDRPTRDRPQMGPVRLDNRSPVVPVRPVTGPAVGPVRLGSVLPGGAQGEAMMRAREAASRRRDSVMRVMHMKRDTARERPK